jgi:hypothetical protein
MYAVIVLSTHPPQGAIVITLDLFAKRAAHIVTPQRSDLVRDVAQIITGGRPVAPRQAPVGRLTKCLSYSRFPVALIAHAAHPPG